MMKRHVDSVHEVKKKFQCEKCDYRSGQKSDMNRHVASVHEHIKPFKCNLCENRFAQRPHLNKHIAYVHSHEVYVHEGKENIQIQ